MHIKATMKYHYIPIEWLTKYFLKVNKCRIPNNVEDSEEMEYLYFTGGNTRFSTV